MKLPLDPWENGVLNQEEHETLVRRRDQYAENAGIPVQYLWVPDSFFDNEELVWVRGFKSNKPVRGIAGLAYIGENFHPPVADRMFALAGKVIRHQIGAKIGYIEQIFSEAKYQGYPQDRMLLLPTFCAMASDQGKGFSAASMLLQRYANAKQQTVVYAPSEEDIRKAHGSMVLDHIKQNYTVIKGVKK